MMKKALQMYSVLDQWQAEHNSQHKQANLSGVESNLVNSSFIELVIIILLSLGRHSRCLHRFLICRF